MTATAETQTKVCGACAVEKPWSEFYIETRSGRPRSRCKACLLTYNKPYGRRHDKKRASGSVRQGSDSRRRYSLYRDHGTTQEAYLEMFNAQGGVCAICKLPESIVRRGRLSTLAVDHCHRDGTLRGLLCNRCNLLLGKVDDNVDILAAAIAYLAR